MTDVEEAAIAPGSESLAKRARTDELPGHCVHRPPTNVFAPQVLPDVLTTRLLAALLPHRAKPHLEVEVRLCVLCDERQQRMRLPIETPAIVTKARRADAGVSKQDFDRIQQLLRSTASKQEAVASWAVRHTHTRDVVRDGVRESFDAATGSLTSRVKKQRLVVCDVTCPKHRYDLRFAVNQEVPVDDALVPVNSPSPPAGDGGNGGGYVREKVRTAFDCAFLSFDTTEVRERGGNGVASYEVELEGALGTDSSSDAALVQAMISNALSLLDALVLPSKTAC